MKLKLPHSTQNWLSVVGATIALISLFMIIFLFVISSIFGQGGSYLGLIIYILLPAIMITGMILIPIGMIITARKIRREKKDTTDDWPKLDLNDIRHRNAFFIFTIGTTIFLFLSAVGSYEAFHFTESVTFCGEICHSVMKPEYTAYQHSPHARVSCVECHVGSGADWYVRSKLSGMYQVYAVLADVYPRPIPTPIKNLRPARETCEECHWPQKFYAQELRQERHYLNDEKNTQWDIRLRMKIGADHSALGLTEGIHWHINPGVKIEFIASDERNQNLPWVRYTNLETGKSVIFKDEDEDIPDSLVTEDNMHTMDCMDCHNRPSHNYRPPAFFINDFMTAGDIPVELPGIKSLAMEICAEDFPVIDSAKVYIEKTVREHYKSDYPEIYEQKPQLIEKAISGIQNAYSQNIFPQMKVKWSAYPNNIGHLEFNGCFRCHNDRHVNENGEYITRNCNLCHAIDAQGTRDHMEVADFNSSLEFKHPVDIDEAWKESLCTDCHTGLNP
jgi:nitrate/TMAO reductase-like tetraheme cytochrome c subunit